MTSCCAQCKKQTLPMVFQDLNDVNIVLIWPYSEPLCPLLFTQQTHNQTILRMFPSSFPLADTCVCFQPHLKSLSTYSSSGISSHPTEAERLCSPQLNYPLELVFFAESSSFHSSLSRVYDYAFLVT